MVIDDDREVSAVENHYLMTVIATASNPRITVSVWTSTGTGPMPLS